MVYVTVYVTVCDLVWHLVGPRALLPLQRDGYLLPCTSSLQCPTPLMRDEAVERFLFG